MCWGRGSKRGPHTPLPRDSFYLTLFTGAQLGQQVSPTWNDEENRPAPGPLWALMALAHQLPLVAETEGADLLGLCVLAIA